MDNGLSNLITVRSWVGWMMWGLLAVAALLALLPLLGWVGTGLSAVGPFLSDVVYSFSYAWYSGQADAICTQ